jgi:hypothetical protein
MKTSSKKPFIPRNKPKSWVIGVLAGLSGLLFAAPVLVVGSYFGFHFLYYIGKFLFLTCWFIFALMWVLGFVQLIRGKYRNIGEKDWEDQVW